MRIALVLLSLGWVSVSWGQSLLESPNGVVYQIADTTHGAIEGPAEFSGWPQLCVRSCVQCDAPCDQADIYSAGGAPSTPELNGRQLLTALQRHPTGLDVQRRIYVPSAGGALADGFVRYLDTFTNPQAENITVAIRLGTVAAQGGRLANLASTIWRTQSDDASLQPEDRWFVIDDDQEAAGLSATGVVLQGAGGRLVVRRLDQAYPVEGVQGSLAWDFHDVVVPAGQTVGILTIVTQNRVRRDTLSEVRSLQRVRTVDAIFGLTDAQRALTANFDISPENSAPVADAGGPYTVNEGMPLELSGLQSFDAEGQALEYSWDLSDDGQLNFVDADTANTTQTFPDNGVLSVALRVVDAGGKIDIDTARVQVLNVPPRIDSVSTSSPISEGETLDVEVRVTEPGADVLTFDFDWDGDGQIDTDGLADRRAQHRYFQDGVFNLRVVVEDDDGGRTEQVSEVVVRNVAPQILQVLAPERVPEGTAFVLQVVARDPGNDPITYAYDLDGDGVFERAGPGLDRLDLTFDDDGLYPIGIRLCDDQDACTARDLFVSVENVRPAVEQIEVTTPINEGESARISVRATDVVGDQLTYGFDFDNDGDFADDVPGQLNPSVSVPFPDDGVFNVGVRVEDGDGGRALDVVEIVVNNVAPFVLLRGPAGTRQGIEETFNCQATDPGADRLVYDWDFDGDGQFELRGARAEERHTFPVQADIEIACRVSDGDGGETVARHRIVIANERPTLELRVDSPQDEGTEVVVRAVANDVGGDELLYTFDFEDDGEIDVGPTDNPIARHVYPDQGQYRIRAVVTDGVDSIDASIRIQIVNRAPIIRLSSNTPINEGETLELTAEVIEPGDDQVILRWDLDGDGVPDPGIEDLVEDDDVVRTIVINDNARLDITVWGDDGDGGLGEAVAAVNIRNLDPTFAENYFPPAAREGRPYNRSIPASDPAGINDPLRYSLVEPMPGIDIEAETGLLLWVPTYSHVLSSPITLRVRIDDDDGGTAQADVEFEVLAIDEDGDGIPDTYETMTCSPEGVCLDPSDPSDAEADPDMDGRDNRTEWAEGTDPFQFEGPELTQLVAPVDGERVPTLTPTLVAARAEDSRGEQVRVQFQVFRDEELQDQLLMSDPILQGEMGDTSWVIPEEQLEEDVSYWWRAKVLTETAETRWTAPWRFRINAENTPPTSPMPIAPPDGAQIDTLQPILRVTTSIDTDQDVLRYIFRVYDQAGEIYTTGEGVASDGEIHFETPALVENGQFTWDAVAIDEASAESENWTPWSLEVDADNTVPSIPILRSPVPDMLVEVLNPTFVAGGSTDEDGDGLEYVFSVRSEAGDVLEAGDPVSPNESGDASWIPERALSEDTQYIATVHSIDARGGVSDTVAHDFFVSADNGPPPVPVLISPVSGGRVLPADALLVWDTVEDPERGTVSYIVEFCRGEQCTRSAPQEFGALNVSDQIIQGATYTWTVEAFDPEGMSSGASASSIFSVIDVEGGASSDGCGCTSWASRQPGGGLLMLMLAFLLGYPRRFRR